MLQAQYLLVLFLHFCDTGCYLIKRRSMQGINAWIVSLPYADPGFFLGGRWGGLPENNPDIFLVLNFKGFQKWIWYLLSLIYLLFHTYCQWKKFRKHLLLLVKSINNLSLPLRTISACILRYYVIEATQVTVCYSAYTWFSNFDKYTAFMILLHMNN